MTPKPKPYKPVGRRKYFSNHFLIYKSPFSPESISLGSHIFVQSNVPGTMVEHEHESNTNPMLEELTDQKERTHLSNS